MKLQRSIDLRMDGGRFVWTCPECGTDNVAKVESHSEWKTSTWVGNRLVEGETDPEDGSPSESTLQVSSEETWAYDPETVVPETMAGWLSVRVDPGSGQVLSSEAILEGHAPAPAPEGEPQTPVRESDPTTESDQEVLEEGMSQLSYLTGALTRITQMVFTSLPVSIHCPHCRRTWHRIDSKVSGTTALFESTDRITRLLEDG